MSYLIDTNICIYIMNERPRPVLQKFKTFAPGDLAISAITVSELQYGIAKSQYPVRNQQRLDEFLRPFQILEYDNTVARAYGTIRAQLERDGTPIGPLDTLIAAHALAHNLAVVTNNEKEFRRVNGLLVENWV